MLEVLTLWAACEGKPGLSALREWGGALFDGMTLVSAARAERLDEEMRRARKGGGGDE